MSGCVLPWQQHWLMMTTLIVNFLLDEGDIIRAGELVEIPLRDGTVCTVKIEGLGSPQDEKRKKKFLPMQYEYGRHTSGEFYVYGVPSNAIKTIYDPDLEYYARFICITPYKELLLGNLSIYDYIEAGYTVPEKVISYLKTTQPFFMSPGVYPHPFYEDKTLLGPYTYCDDKYYWDGDTWKYVEKYGLRLPEEFIQHVMSEEGYKYMEKYIGNFDL